MTSWSSVGGLGRSRGLCWRSCATLGAYVGGLGPLLRPLWAVLGRSWGLPGRSWAAPGACLGGLGRSRGLCWRSCAALGAYVGGLGPLVGLMLAVWGCFWGLGRRSWGVLVPKRSVLEGDQAEKWLWPERESDLDCKTAIKSQEA